MLGLQVTFIAALGGALALVVVAVVLVLRARRRAKAELGVEEDLDDSATIWAGHDGTTIVVRRHGRARPERSRPALTAVNGGALLPMSAPWEPPQSW